MAIFYGDMFFLCFLGRFDIAIEPHLGTRSELGKLQISDPIIGRRGHTFCVLRAFILYEDDSKIFVDLKSLIKVLKVIRSRFRHSRIAYQGFTKELPKRNWKIIQTNIRRYLKGCEHVEVRRRYCEDREERDYKEERKYMDSLDRLARAQEKIMRENGAVQRTNRFKGVRKFWKWLKKRTVGKLCKLKKTWGKKQRRKKERRSGYEFEDSRQQNAANGLQLEQLVCAR